MIVADKSCGVSDPSIESQSVAPRFRRGHIFLVGRRRKDRRRAIRKVGELGWKPKFFLANTATTVGSVLKPVGLDYSKGIISTAHLKDPTKPKRKDDSGGAKWRALMAKYYPDGDQANANMAYAYVQSQAMVLVLKQCGDELTRANVMKEATNLKDFSSDVLLPGS
jgi:ABC-type branched-subunit amino acid transport system substrate-binding protein